MNPKFHDLVVTHWGARFMGYTLPIAIGRSGIAEKVGEGDGITPIGNFLIKSIGFRNDRISFTSPNIEKKHTRLNDLWSDDPRDKNYNHKVYSNDYSFSHEKLRRSDKLYDEAFSYLKRVIVTPTVYPLLVEFLHFGIQSAGQKLHCVITL